MKKSDEKIWKNQNIVVTLRRENETTTKTIQIMKTIANTNNTTAAKEAAKDTTTDLLTALNMILSQAVNTPAEIHVQRAIESLKG